MLRDRALAPFIRSAAWRPAAFLLLLLAIAPAAEARTIKVDGHVTAPPTAVRGTVAVPIELTRRSARAVNLGTRRVTVRLAARARLRLSGPGASGASRLTARSLRAGDRLKGVTSLTRRARRRMRWHARPELKLKRARVIRPAAPAPTPPRAFRPPAGAPPAGAPPAGGPPSGGSPGTPAPPGPSPISLAATFAQLQADTAGLSARAAGLGPQIDAQDLRLESFKTSAEDAMAAFDSLKTALENLAGPVDQQTLDALLDQVGQLRLRVEALKNGIGPIDSMLGDLDGAVSKVDAALDKLVPMVENLAGQLSVAEQTAGAPELVISLAGATAALNGRLATAEARLDSLVAGTDALINEAGSVVIDIETLASAAGAGANLTTLGVGIAALDEAVGELEAGFEDLLTTTDALLPDAETIETDAPGLETTVGQICGLVPATCP